MANPLIPRETVHRWSEEIGENALDHSTSLQRLLKDQRRLTRFIEENSQQMVGATGGICVYMTGVIARMFDMAGGQLRSATWAQIRDAESRIQGHLAALLPPDDGFVDRFHAITDRAQAHILDEAAMVLFQVEKSHEAEEDLVPVEALKVLLVSWVVADVLDANWRPGKDFVGEASYTYHHIEPEKKAPAEGAGA